MTIKEITELTGRTYKTVCNWCAKITELSVKITEAKETSKPADFTLEETIKILEAGNISKMIIEMLRENAENKKPVKESILTEKDFAIINALIQGNIKALIPQSIFNQPIVKQIDPPKLRERDQLRQLVSKIAEVYNIGHPIAWYNLYNEYFYRNHKNIILLSKNRNISAIDYAEKEGLLPDLIAIAKEKLK